MLRLLIGFVALALAVPAQAEEKPSKAAEQLGKLQAEFQKAQQEFRKAVQEAKEEDRQKLIDKQNPGPKFFALFLGLAEKEAKDPVAIDALFMALRTAGQERGAASNWGKAMAVLTKDHASSAQVAKIVRALAGSIDEPAVKFLREVLEKNTNRTVQARALESLVAGVKQKVQLAERINDDEALKGRVEKALGKEFAAALIKDAEANKKEEERLAKLIKEKFGDVFPDLSVGKPAPEVISRNLEGKEVKLSELKGKVVVLDVWATWCPPCRAMIPHERDLVAKLVNKPFVLVSISADEKKETLTEFLKKEPMPWTHWWNGQTGGILEDWSITSFPTIYVLDAKGIIRYKNVRNKAMDEAVTALLKELDEKK